MGAEQKERSVAWPNHSNLFYTILLQAVFSIVHLLLVLCGDIEINPGPRLSYRPTWPQLISLRCPVSGDQPLRVIKWITSCEPTQCADLAHLLLRDDITVKKLLMKNADSDQFVRAVLKEWLNKDDDHNDPAAPRTWAALAECVQEADLPGALAKAIRDATAPLPPAAVQNTVQPAPHLPDHAHSPHLSGSAHSPHLPDPASQVYPARSTPDPLIATYRQYLKDLYSAEYPDYSKPQFTVNRPKQIVNLVLVHRVNDEVDKIQQQCLLYQLHGNIDLIQQKKTPLTKDKIGLLANGGTAHRVLIEGAPGIGKTTFLWQLCHQWADSELLQQWELVILVQLRDETTRTAQCLSDLLYHPDNDISKAVCCIVERREGENVLIIFDGYDELSDDQHTESFFLNILRQPRFLRKATMVVSSRPFATETLPHQFKDNLDQHVEIIGFNEQDIEAYLASACQDNPDMLRDLKIYISTQPFISSVLYNPLHCTIVTELYLQYWQRGEKGFAPNTLTQLYEALVLNLLRRHFGFNVTPSWPDVCHKLNQLAELSATGIEQRKYIFNNVPSDTFGLMHSFKHLHDCRPNQQISHTFTHLTLQEFLAAYYWSKLSPQHLTELLRRQDLFPVEEYLKGIHHELKMPLILRVTHWPVLLFLAGLTQFTTVPELISPRASQRSRVSQENFFTNSSSLDTRIKFHPSLCQLLFEAQSPQLVQTVFYERKVHPVYDKMRITPLDWFAIGYCIAHSDTTSSWIVVFGNILSTSHPQCLQAFSSGLHYSSSSTHSCADGEIGSQLTELTLYSDSHVSPYLDIFPSLSPYTQAITVLWLAGDLSSDDTGVSVLQTLSEYCPRLKNLALPSISPHLVQLPQTLDTLYLRLPHKIDDSILCENLQQCLALKHLILWPVDEETDITSSLTVISPLLAAQIEHLELQYVSINSTCVEKLVHSLTSPHSTLHKLGLSSCTISSSDYCRLTASIATSNLTHFTTDNLHINVSAAKGLARALKQSETPLEEVEVKEQLISSDVAQVLAQAMNNSRVKKLMMKRVNKGTISDCSYPTDRVEALQY